MQPRELLIALVVLSLAFTAYWLVSTFGTGPTFYLVANTTP